MNPIFVAMHLKVSEHAKRGMELSVRQKQRNAIVQPVVVANKYVMKKRGVVHVILVTTF